MSDFWLPPRAATLPRAKVPAGDVTLADGRVLRRHVPWMHGVSFREGQGDGLRVLASVDPTDHGDLLHVSVSYADRDPSWDDIRAVRDAFFPATVDAMMVLPRAVDYVNVHPHCFHLWQTPIGWGIQ